MSPFQAVAFLARNSRQIQIHHSETTAPCGVDPPVCSVGGLWGICRTFRSPAPGSKDGPACPRCHLVYGIQQESEQCELHAELGKRSLKLRNVTGSRNSDAKAAGENAPACYNKTLKILFFNA